MSAATEDSLPAQYAAELRARGFDSDPAQQRAVGSLDQLRQQLSQPARGRGALGRLLRRDAVTSAPRGLYLWGGVGRGKTWLMDLFFDGLPFPERRRLHFHHFIREVHAELRSLPRQTAPLQTVAQRMREETRLLCLDELFVNDIADAMILGGLFKALLEAGVTLVITSNVPPSGLYRDGLQRARFLPAIALLEKQLQVLQLDGGTDYRLRQLRQAPIYLADGAAAREQLGQLFHRLADAHAEHNAELCIGGRPIAAWRRSSDVVWFDFASLCEGPRSQHDYGEIADEFHTVFVSDVPRFDETHDDAARRFIALVDEFYDRGVKLVLSAAAPPTQLYGGQRLRFEFERTASRLIEMQSEEYLARAHRG